MSVGKSVGARPAARRARAAAATGSEPIEAYFATRGWQPFEFQRAAWQAWRDGVDGLIHAPTGTGKTWAAFGGAVIDALAKPSSTGTGKGTGASGKCRLRLLWVTPLRALANDTRAALQTGVDALGIDWRVALKTGDSSSRERAAIRRGACDVLVTTPESLALMLTWADARELFAALDGIVIDEWHELLGSKRGVLLELNLARLRALAEANQRPLRCLGVSATLGNLTQALAVLCGPGRDGRLIDARTPKRIEIEALLPDSVTRFPWAGHLGLSQLPQVLDALSQARSTLLFTNTRAQAELWYRALDAVWPEPAATLALHHGSIDRSAREAIENALRAGGLRCVVATSSLDLGVDFAPVDQVIQIGSPKGVARLLQRAGRSGHQPNAASRIRCVPTHTLELLEIAAARRAAAAGQIEARRPLRLCLDVLAQHLVSSALAEGFNAPALLAEVRRTHAFAALDQGAWEDVLALVVQGGKVLGAYPDFARVVADGEHCRISSPRAARLQRMAIGTIVAHGSLRVRLIKGAALGQVEEGFLARLAPADRFVFAGRTLELVRLHDQTAWVRAARDRHAVVPRWMGSRLPLSSELADGIRALLADQDASEPEMQLAAPLLAKQRAISRVPTPDQLLIERITARDGEHLFIYSFAGRHAHLGLAALIAARIARLAPASYSYAVSDYGFTIASRRLPPLDDAALRRLFSAAALEADLADSINLAELAKRRFREVAQIAGLLAQGPPGRGKSVRQLMQSSSLLFEVLTRYEPDHVLLRQARTEVLEDELDASRLRAALSRIARSELIVQAPRRLTPLAFPLWAEGIRGRLSTEDWQARVERMAGQLERQP